MANLRLQGLLQGSVTHAQHVTFSAVARQRLLQLESKEIDGIPHLTQRE